MNLWILLCYHCLCAYERVSGAWTLILLVYRVVPMGVSGCLDLLFYIAKCIVLVLVSYDEFILFGVQIIRKS